MIYCSFVFKLVSVDLLAKRRDRQCRDIGAVEVHRQVTSCCVVPDDQVPPEASQVLDGLGSQLLFACVFDLLLCLPIYNDLKLIHRCIQKESDIDVESVFISEPEA